MNKRHLKDHVVNVHETSNVCHVCAKVFGGKYSLKRHIQYEHEGKPKPLMKCTLCDAKFGSR